MSCHLARPHQVLPLLLPDVLRHQSEAITNRILLIAFLIVYLFLFNLSISKVARLRSSASLWEKKKTQNDRKSMAIAIRVVPALVAPLQPTYSPLPPLVASIRSVGQTIGCTGYLSRIDVCLYRLSKTIA